MTTNEFYYLMMCLGSFGVFAASLAYSSWSWSRWQRSRAAADAAPKRVEPRAKLAA